MHRLSKSVSIMFLFDLIVLALSSSFWYLYIGLPKTFFLPVCALIVLSGLITLYLKSNYEIREFNITSKNTYLLFEGIIFAHIPAALLLYFAGNPVSIIKFFIANIVFIFVILRIYRALFHIYLFNIKKTKNILIIGTNHNAKVIAEEIRNKKALRMNVAAFVKDTQQEEDNEISSLEKIYSASELKEAIESNKIDIIIIAIKRRLEEQLLTDMVFSIPRSIDVYKMPEFYEMVTGKYYVDTMSINWLFYDFMNRRSFRYSFCKRAFDIIAASIVLLVSFPILAYIAIRVKLTDGESPIYTQKRVGREGKVFNCYKLRTMYKNDYIPKNVKNGGYAESQDKDDRVIPFCKFVRKARFDEIPQMINILKGDMSIVGPRTEWEDLVKIYSNEIPFYICRQWVKTGWTGWAQINQGHCINNDDIAEKLKYDLYYLKHRNVLWEIGILVKAVFLALGGRHG